LIREMFIIFVMFLGFYAFFSKRKRLMSLSY